jgi:hypothetical protein
MRELFGNIWDLASGNDFVAITTNGFVKRDGSCVMGRGIAKQAMTRDPHLPLKLGMAIRRHGNRVFFFNNIITFPVKPTRVTANNSKSNIVRHMQHRFDPGNSVPGWASVATYDIIRKSMIQLTDMIDRHGWQNRRILMPRPGCGAGELEWDMVKPLLQPFVGNRPNIFFCTYSQDR